MSRLAAPSPAQLAVLEALERSAGPVTLAGLIADTGLHENTLREHLEALLGLGLVRRQRSTPSGRGRPAWRYQAVEDGAAPGRGGEYAGLASALAAHLHHHSPAPRRDAELAGEAWGRDLAADPPAGPAGDPDPAEQVIALLGGLGFDPRRRGATGTVELTRCPLLQAARRYPDVVCGVHLGIVRGSLDHYGADGSATRLYPFDAPGFCRLELGDPGRRPPA
jgi:predicted ArsR family transcriptional regulator